MRTLPAALTAAALFTITASAQEWEIAAQAGFGIYRNATIKSQAGTAKAGFASGALFSVLGGHNMYRYVGGEARYIYAADDLRIADGSTVKLGGQSHTFDYSFLFHATPSEAAVRPFVSVGAGGKWFRATGPETAFQPLSNIAVLTRTTEWKAEVSFGGGVKVRAGKHGTFRVDFRDYASPFPSKVIAPRPPTGRVNGWLHDFVFMVGAGVAF
jgi:hypothetical protein